MGVNAQYSAWYVNTFNYNIPQPADSPDRRFFRLWQMAVAVPIPNFHFTYPKKQNQAIIADATSGDAFILVGFTNANDRIQFKNLLASKNYALVSNTITKTSEGVRLSGDTEDINDSTNYNLRLYIEDVLQYSYTANNAIIEFYTSKLAEKWSLDNKGLLPLGIRKGLPIELTDIDGKLFAQQLRLTAAEFNLTEKKFYTEIPNLQEYAYANSGYTYRIGCRYYLAYTTAVPDSMALGGEIYVKLPGTNSPNKILLNYLNGTFNKYYLFNSIAFNDWKSYDLIKIIEANRRLEVSFVGFNTPTYDLDFGLDDIYLEHSAGFENILGALLLTMAPDRDSLDIGSDQTEESIKLANADRFPYFPYGNPNRTKKYSIGCTFTNSNMDTYEKLKILEMWQNDGFNLNLHTHMSELPEVLTGRMTLGHAKKGVFDFKKISFDFYFEEV